MIVSCFVKQDPGIHSLKTVLYLPMELPKVDRLSYAKNLNTNIYNPVSFICPRDDDDDDFMNKALVEQKVQLSPAKFLQHLEKSNRLPSKVFDFLSREIFQDSPSKFLQDLKTQIRGFFKFVKGMALTIITVIIFLQTLVFKRPNRLINEFEFSKADFQKYSSTTKLEDTEEYPEMNFQNSDLLAALANVDDGKIRYSDTDMSRPIASSRQRGIELHTRNRGSNRENLVEHIPAHYNRLCTSFAVLAKQNIRLISLKDDVSNAMVDRAQRGTMSLHTFRQYFILKMGLNEVIQSFSNESGEDDHQLIDIYVTRSGRKTLLHCRFWLVTEETFNEARRSTATIEEMYYTVILPTDSRMNLYLPTFLRGLFHEKDVIDGRIEN